MDKIYTLKLTLPLTMTSDSTIQDGNKSIQSQKMLNLSHRIEEITETEESGKHSKMFEKS